MSTSFHALYADGHVERLELTIGRKLLHALFTIAGGEDLYSLRSKREHAGTISGLIVAPNGAPLSGGRVWLDTHGDVLLAEAKTVADGRFSLGPVKPVRLAPV